MSDAVQKKTTPVDFEELAALLLIEGVMIVSPSELHGAVSGAVAGGQKDLSHCVGFMLDMMDVRQLKDKNSQLILERMVQQIVSGLSSDTLEFTLMLADESADLSLQVQSLGLWCQQFMSGFGLQEAAQKKPSAEVAEYLADLAEISYISDEVEETEESEVDLTELIEYVRMGALLLYADTQSKDQKADSAVSTESRTLH